MATPPPPASGAEIDAVTITNAEVAGNGAVVVQVDTFADKANANDVTITNTSTDPISTLTVEKFGDNDGEADVIRIDLSEFDDDFALVLANTGNTVQDQLYLEGVHEFLDNGDGTFTATYYGTDSELHSIQIDPEDANVTPYYASDGEITGSDGAETMGDGYADIHEDEIGSGDGSDADNIVGGAGSDTINGGAGHDTILGDNEALDGRLDPALPDKVYTGAPGGPAAGAEVDTFTISNGGIDGNGKVKVEVDTFATKENANDVTIAHGGSNPITEIAISKGGGSDGEADVFRFDLSTFDDDFLVTLAEEDALDSIVFEGVHSVSDNGDGTWDLTYYGSDTTLHSVTVDPDTADVEFYVTPESPYFHDDVIDAGAGDDQVDGGYGDDSIDGDIGDDTLVGGIGSDTIEGGDGADAIYGDWDQPLAPRSAPAPSGTAEIDTFSIGDGEIDAGAVDIVVEDFASIDSENDVLVTGDASSESIDTIHVGKFSGSGGEADVIRFDLSTFDDDFTVTTASEGIEDTFVFEGITEIADDGDGTWTISYYGDDNELHTVDVQPGDASVEAYYAPAPEALLTDTDDDLSGGAGDDTIEGGYGDDLIDGGADHDSLDGGFGDDTLIGGDGDDTLSGGASGPEVPLDRVAFEWSAVPDPGDGGQIDDNDTLVGTGTQTVNGVDVDYTITGSVSYSPGGEDGAGNVFTGGIDAGSGAVNGYSAASWDDSGTMDLTFSEPVENVQFNINDLETVSSDLTITAYDEFGNEIPFTVIEGAVVVGSDTDTIAGNDSFAGTGASGGDDDDLGSVQVTIPGPVANIVIDFASGSSDSLTMTDIWFDDPFTGGEVAGDDSLDGGAGDDVFEAGNGDDTLSGGTGTDSYDASVSGDLADETITVTVDGNGDGTSVKTNDGGTDSFTSIEDFTAGEAAGEADTITITDDVAAGNVTGFSNATVGTFTPGLGASGPITFGGSGEPTINDLLSGGYVDPTHGVIKPIGSYQITGGEEDGAQVGATSFSNFENINFSVVCFAGGTLIDTADGERRIEALRSGDLVRTLDRGMQPIRWIGSTRVSARDLAEHPQLRPVRLSPGALGPGRPHRALTVSPQHRILVRSRISRRMFGCDEVLTAAKKLVGLPGIEIVEDLRAVSYFHMLFDNHEIVFADGAPAESLLPGPMAIEAFDAETRAEIAALFPKGDVPGYHPRPARLVPKGHRIRTLRARHARNGQPLLETPR